MFKTTHKKNVLRNTSMLLIAGIISQISAPVVYAAELQKQRFARADSREIAGGEFLKVVYGALGQLYAGLQDQPIVHAKPDELSIINSVEKRNVIPMIPEQEKSLSVRKTLGGPGQSESSGFSLNSTDGLVDKFTGDFSYSLPVMDVEGFPIALSYNSNVNMNSEASWVGLGWDLNVGAVTREMRGIPDEFNGTDQVTRTESQLKEELDGNKLGGYLSLSYGFGAGGDGVIFTPSIQMTLLAGKYTSNLLGRGYTRDFGLQVRFDLSTSQDYTGGSPNDKDNYIESGGLFGLNFGLGYSKDSKAGSGLNTSFGGSFGFAKSGNKNAIGLNFGVNSHSREGLTDWYSGYSAYSATNKRALGLSHVSSAPYGTQTTIPTISMGNTSSSFQFNLDVFVGVATNGLGVQVGFLNQKYNHKNTTVYNGTAYNQSALGYLHSGKRSKFGNEKLVMMDYQRTNDGEYSQEMKHLPGSFQAFDLFYYNSPTQSGSFRANRTDYGTYFDPIVKSQHNSLQDSQLSDFYDKLPDLLADVLGTILSPDIVNLGLGVLVKNGSPRLQISLGLGKQEKTTEYNTPWDHGVNYGRLLFHAEAAGNDFDQSVYFKNLGENTPTEMGAWNYMEGNNLSSYQVDVVNKKIEVGNTLSGVTKSSAVLNTQNPKPITAVSIDPQIAEDVNAPIYNYQGVYNSTVNTLPRVGGTHKTNHISSVEIVDENGVKNIYGVPAYNNHYTNVTFSSGGLSNSGAILEYNQSGPFADNSVGNTRGRSHYYDKTQVPGFAHSFLLTQVLGPDYVDRTNDGVSLDDVGTYHKINYTLATNSYKWRIPISGVSGSAKAYHNPGFLGTALDDIGTYTYGEKELWYTHSVEGKNLIAVFVLSDRKDGHQVDENGFINPSSSTLKKLQKLDKIILYNRDDYYTNGVNATEIQTVLFEYEYSLCKNFPGNHETYGGVASESGKLTLKSIRAMGGKSFESGLRNYEFAYSASNPSFSYQNVDGWGCYQANDSQLPNHIYPYTSNKYTPTSDQEALERGAAWKLTTIKLPTGGEMGVNYDSDKYAYVQDKRAMRQFTIEGMMTEQDLYSLGSSWNGSTGLSDEFRSASGNFISYRNVLIFKLDKELGTGFTQAEANNEVRKLYFKDPYNGSELNQLYIKAHVEIKPGVEELVPMFLPLDNDNHVIGAMPAAADGTRKYGFAVLKLFDVSEMESKDKRAKKWAKHGTVIHPIQRVSLDYARQNLPDKIYGACASCDSDMDENIDKRVLFGTLIYKYMIEDAHYSSKLVPSKTLVRLYEPDNVKIGGNARVTNITYSDNWDVISGEYKSTYTWDYSYGDQRVESTTGVAAFEPLPIYDENVHYLWDTYVNIKEKFIDETKFHALPIFRPLYPNANVGYSEVKVTFNGSVNKGKSVSTFHTYKEKEYCTTERYTTVGAQDDGNKSVYSNKGSFGKFLGARGLDFYGFKEGFLLFTNDFHGKPIKYTTYDGDGYAQASTTYTYYDKFEEIPMLDRKGKLSNYRVATEYDIHAEQRAVEDFSHFHLGGLGVGITFMPPFLYFSPYYTWNNSDRAFYSYTLVKHLNYYARVKSVETVYLNSKNTAQNLIYDKYSGAVLANSIKDEYNDELYQFSYPSHWYLPGLREIRNHTAPASYTGTVSGNTFTITSGDLEDLFAPGDEIRLINVANPSTTYVATVMSTGKTSLKLIHNTGLTFSGINGGYSIRLVATNRSNRLSENIQNVVTKKEISVTPTESFAFPVSEIINAAAITYRDKHNVRCGKMPNEGEAGNQVPMGTVINPFKYGVIGDLVLDSQLSWQSERINHSHPHGTRFDGAYSNYTPYYSLDGTTLKWKPLAALGNWRRMGESRLHNEYGVAQEGVDQLNIPSAVIYGYSNKLELLPIAQAVNAHKQDIGFDGFEDYGYYATGALPKFDDANYHFSFMQAVYGYVSPSTEQKHSGLYSLKVNPGASAVLDRAITAACDAQPNGMSEDVFVANSCVCIPPFRPTSGKEYIVGGWIRKGTSSASINVRLTGGGAAITPVMTTGREIEGWVRVESQPFEIPVGYTGISISLTNSGVSPVYFDDIRVHPFLAGMTTVVYDPVTLLPIATHDGYNYTTFYNYDENLELVRIKVETEEGIKTVMERENGGKIKFND
ncbi:hypothetical protein D3C87_84750 [compost metagenome]